MKCCANNGCAEPRPGASGGFTLIELLVVMGILTGFLTMLVQLVDNGLTMFRDGELSQDLADRAARAQRVIGDELSLLRGSAGGPDRERADDRLVVQQLPIGLPPSPERGATRVQVLRGSVFLAPEREVALLRTAAALEALAEQPQLEGDALDVEVQKRVGAAPLRGIGNLLLVPWRQADDDALLELRCGWFLPGQQLPVGPGREVDPFEVPVPGSPQLPGMLVYQSTIPILRELLHVEFLLWAQDTTSWGSGRDTRGPSGGGGQPMMIWDSARAGWLVDRDSGGEFRFDRGPLSATDTSDDVHPHAILVRCVVAQQAGAAAEGLVADEMGAEDTSLVLVAGDRFPGAPDGGFVKVDGEWMRYAERDGDWLRGLQRGARSTKPIPHDVGSRVHVGRTIEFVIPLLHAKDDWND
ncbi:MAG: type II secretion system protein [Planctomycetes bacterium]|nr:type II secretion system protein [Planctomycetota bacterium]